MRPRVGVSACLLGQEVRHDGGHKRNAFVVGDLAAHVELIPVCPEVEIGLGVPREPIRLESGPSDSLAGTEPARSPSAGGAGGGPGLPRLVTVESRRDLTERMRAYAELRVTALAALGLDGYVTKSKSPSCALQGVPVHGANAVAPGAFIAILRARLPGLAIVEESTLENPAARAAFLAAVLASARG
jgi:uncharacterized protein YbbK (DUF523 family)